MQQLQRSMQSAAGGQGSEARSHSQHPMYRPPAPVIDILQEDENDEFCYMCGQGVSVRARSEMGGWGGIFVWLMGGGKVHSRRGLHRKAGHSCRVRAL
jgi:hypothetical protein